MIELKLGMGSEGLESQLKDSTRRWDHKMIFILGFGKSCILVLNM